MYVQMDKERLLKAIELLTFYCDGCPLRDSKTPCAQRNGCWTEKSCETWVWEWLMNKR